MSGGLQFDEETSRKVESLYMTPDVVAQRRQVLKALALKEGERVLDIGSGPGLSWHMTWQPRSVVMVAYAVSTSVKIC